MAIKSPRAAKSNKGVGQAVGGFNVGNNVFIGSVVGVPTNGASGTKAAMYGPGSTLHSTNGNVYRNSGTKASPTWTAM